METSAIEHGAWLTGPLIFHGAHSAPEAEVAAHIDVLRQRLTRYPQWPELADMDTCPECEVPSSDRPVDSQLVTEKA